MGRLTHELAMTFHSCGQMMEPRGQENFQRGSSQHHEMLKEKPSIGNHKNNGEGGAGEEVALQGAGKTGLLEESAAEDRHVWCLSRQLRRAAAAPMASQGRSLFCQVRVCPP